MKKFFTLIAMMFVAGATFAQDDVEWGPNQFENSDLEADAEYPWFHVKSNVNNPEALITTAVPEAGVGVDGSKGIKVVAGAGASQAWDSQFWIQIPDEIANGVLEYGEQVLITFDCRADFTTVGGEEVTEINIGTQGHNAPGSYRNNTGVGTVTFTKEWSTHSQAMVPDACPYSIAFNLCEGHLEDDVTFYFDNITIQRIKPNEEVVLYWAKMIQNGNCESDNSDSFVVRIYQQGDAPATFVEGEGVDETRAIKIVVPAKVSEDWDSQFFIKLKEPLPVGQSFKVSFDYRASEVPANQPGTQSHQEPGNYIHWDCIGGLDASEEWKTFSKTVSVSSSMTTEEKSFQTITFNLARNDHEITYWFDNIDVRILKEGTAGDIPEILELRSSIESADNLYANADNNAANAELREAFKEAYDNATNIADALDSENAESAMYALVNAQNKFNASINDYNNLQAFIDWVKVKMGAAEAMGDSYADLKDALDEIQGSLQDQYAAEAWVKADITDATQKAPVIAKINAYVAENVADGDDVTILMENPTFAGNTTGWSNSGKALDYGPSYHQNALTIATDGGFLPTGMAEVWHGAFDGYQTLSNLPAGLYTITCNAAQRGDDGSDETAMLYAIVNDSETHKVIMSVYDDPTPEAIYVAANENDTWPSIENPNGDGWIPDGKGSGNYHLNAVKADGSGYYVNTLNVLINEPSDMRFGIKDTNTTGWCIMDNFKIVYHSMDNKLALAAAIEGLVESAESIDTDLLTNPAEADLYAAISTGKKVAGDIENVSKEEADAAFAGLQSAIDDARANIKAGELLESTYWEKFAGILEEYGENAMPAVQTQAAAADAKYDTAENMTTAELNAYIDELNYLAEALLVPAEAAEASDENPVDLTESILVAKGVDVDFEDYSAVGANANYPGWSGSGFGTGGGTAGPVGERWNQTNGFNTYVDLKGLPEGTYILSCDGAYRIGGSAGAADWNVVYGEETTDQYAYLYAETAAGKEFKILPNIAEGKLTEEECANNGIDNTSNCDSYAVNVPTGEVDEEGNPITESIKYYFPNQLYTADQWMQAGFYKNTEVTFKVGADGNARIGVRRDKGQGNNWCYVDNFKLIYLGANSSAQPTAIDNIAVSSASKAIYTISGVRVSNMNKAGLYITNGKKILVK